MLSLEEVGSLSALGRDGGAADFWGGALADTVEGILELVFSSLVDLLAALSVVVVDHDVGTKRLDEL